MTLTATTATYDLVDGAHVTGLAIADGTEGYLIFQRSEESDPDDWGIYFEFSDQSNSGYNQIRKCRINRQMVEVDLAETVAGVSYIKVNLAVDDKPFIKFAAGMREVFRGQQEKLEIIA